MSEWIDVLNPETTNKKIRKDPPKTPELAGKLIERNYVFYALVARPHGVPRKPRNPFHSKALPPYSG